MSQSKSQTQIAHGVVVAGKYRLIQPLGKGAMGVVWSAVHVATSREVALKLISQPEEEHRLRLKREARNCGAVRHPNVVDVLDGGETEGGDPFLVMQLLSGETLAHLLQRKRRLDPHVAAGVGRDIARGLAAAHGLHIVHRDLKPSNIFLHRDSDHAQPVVKVLDFGVAKNLSINDGLHTVTGGLVGSTPYMSPEQIRAGAFVDHRADLWALGVVLFEMLTGERPFQGSAQAICASILAGEIPTVYKYMWRVDPALVEIVSRCMRRDREERFGSAAEVAQRLDSLASPRPRGVVEVEPPLSVSVPAERRAGSASAPSWGSVAGAAAVEAATLRTDSSWITCPTALPTWHAALTAAENSASAGLATTAYPDWSSPPVETMEGCSSALERADGSSSSPVAPPGEAGISTTTPLIASTEAANRANGPVRPQVQASSGQGQRRGVRATAAVVTGVLAFSCAAGGALHMARSGRAWLSGRSPAPAPPEAAAGGDRQSSSPAPPGLPASLSSAAPAPAPLRSAVSPLDATPAPGLQDAAARGGERPAKDSGATARVEPPSSPGPSATSPGPRTSTESPRGGQGLSLQSTRPRAAPGGQSRTAADPCKGLNPLDEKICRDLFSRKP